MTAIASVRHRVRHHPWLARGRHVLRTPKGSLLSILVLMVAVAAARERPDRVLQPLVASIAVAAMIDLPLLRWRRGRWTVPDGGLITALLVTMITSPYDAWPIAPATTAIALASKHLLRWRGVPVLNPAAVGLVAAYVAFDAAHSWWGALSEVPPALAWPLLVLAGGYIIDRVNRLPLVLAFLATYFALFTTLAFVRDSASVAEIFVAPDLQAALFFAAFMLTDPPTSPPQWRTQVTCGVTVAASAAVLFVTTGGAFYLLGALLVSNVLFARGWRGPREPARMTAGRTQRSGRRWPLTHGRSLARDAGERRGWKALEELGNRRRR